MESKYNLLTRLLKNIKNVITPDGGVVGRGGVLVVTDEDGTLDKTWQEIHDADFAVVISAYSTGRSVYFVVDIGHDPENTDFYISIGNDNYSASSASGYPVLVEEEEET